MPPSVLALELFRAGDVVFLSVAARGTALNAHVVLDAVVFSGFEALLALLNLGGPFVVRVVERWRPLDVVLKRVKTFLMGERSTLQFIALSQ